MLAEHVALLLERLRMATEHQGGHAGLPQQTATAEHVPERPLLLRMPHHPVNLHRFGVVLQIAEAQIFQTVQIGRQLLQLGARFGRQWIVLLVPLADKVRLGQIAERGRDEHV